MRFSHVQYLCIHIRKIENIEEMSKRQKSDRGTECIIYRMQDVGVIDGEKFLEF